MKKCRICGRELDGEYSAHNARPIAEGECCEICNRKVVVPARLGWHIYKYTRDLQGADFAVDFMGTIPDWLRVAMYWASDDGNDELVEYLKTFDFDDDEVIAIISNIWELEIERVY